MKKSISILSSLSAGRVCAFSLLVLMCASLLLAAFSAAEPPVFAEDADDLLSETVPEYPVWWPEDTQNFSFYHNDGSPRLIDYADIFTPEEEAKISSKLAEMKAAHSADLVVVTDNSSYGMSHAMYAADFYDYGGYGFGDNYTGAVMFICMEQYNRGWWCAGTGNIQKYFTEKNVNKMDDAMEPYMESGSYAEGVLAYFDKLDVLLTKGRLPLSVSEIVTAALVSAIIGLIAGLINLSKASSTMNTVTAAVKAGQYLEPHSFNVKNATDTLIDTQTTKVFIGSSGSRSGGGSSYSGGYSSSSGHSFSGGGRSF